MSKEVLLNTEFPGLKLFRKGKVRDVYDLKDQLLVVSTDRVSCFDVVLPCAIPDKGKVLTKISLFWFDFIKEVIPSHFITADLNQYPKELQKYPAELSGRSMLVLKCKALPIECVVRGYLSGSAWKEYKSNGSVCGITLADGLKESDKLPEVIFTPTTKADFGHDQNVDQNYVEELLGKKVADKIKEKSIEIYQKASAYALSKGIIIADTKFEFGMYNGEVIIIDEVLTPDSSRFWPLDGYAPGRGQPSFDKQFVRDYLEGLDWDKTPPAPGLPEEIISKTTEKYREAYYKLTGKKLS
ncbi:MAG: phosphoribosylaminoimidazolesuccinocarboxamide synthase [Candidatus Omnitrophica bacterium]|jgi:phosphoribosylaminoimidazole-succinocarboxamide synthase|nr:phosphoribosylaminoimidazolesuccinocarboxamide synthase [Candidatus Omnitrophota bacterium]